MEILQVSGGTIPGREEPNIYVYMFSCYMYYMNVFLYNRALV